MKAGLWLACVVLMAGVARGQFTELTGSVQVAGSVASGANAVALGTNTIASEESALAAGTFTEALAQNSFAAGFLSRANAGHSNSFIFATGAPDEWRQTLAPDSVFFERLFLFSPALDDVRAVLTRGESDARYPFRWDYEAVKEMAFVARTAATAAWAVVQGGGFILTNTADFGGNAASNVSQIYIGYPSQQVESVESPAGSGAIEFSGMGVAKTPGDATWFPSSGDRTVFAWVKPSAATDWQILFQVGVGDAGGAFRLYRTDMGNAHGALGYGDTWTEAPLAADSWSFLVMAYDSASHITRLYVNGLLAGTTEMQLNTIQTAPVALGGYGYNTGHEFNGQIGPVGIYNRALAETEATALFNNGAGTVTPPAQDLLAFWPMLDDAGTTITDTSGNGRHLVIEGSAAWVGAAFDVGGVSFTSAGPITVTNSFAFVPTNFPLRTGDYLAFDGLSGTRWTSLPDDLARYRATTNFNLATHSLTNAGHLQGQTLKINSTATFLGPVSIEPQGDISMGTFTSRP